MCSSFATRQASLGPVVIPSAVALEPALNDVAIWNKGSGVTVGMLGWMKSLRSLAPMGLAGGMECFGVKSSWGESVPGGIGSRCSVLTPQFSSKSKEKILI